LDLLHNTFDAGELSPEMDGRTDRPEYYRGCRTLEGFVAKLSGGACRCPGFEHIAAAKSNSAASRIVGFVNKTDRYILEFGDLVMRVYKNGAIVESGGSAYELVTPYATADLADLVFSARGQLITHPDYDPYKLVCTSDASWALTAANAINTYGPFLDENTVAAKVITPSATTGNITLTASGTGNTPFVTGASGHVGALWELTHQISSASISGVFSSVSASSSLTVKGTWSLEIGGRWAGTVKLQRSYDSGATWLDVDYFTGSLPGNVIKTLKGSEPDDNVVYRLNMTVWKGAYEIDPWTSGFRETDGCTYVLRTRNSWQTGIVRITAVSSTTVATATVLNTLGAATATSKWREGAWSPYRGYPACGTIHDGRAYTGGTSHQPTGIAAGRTFKRIGDARLFYGGTSVEADDAFSRTVDVKGCDNIKWLASQWPLLIGCDGGVIKGIGGTPDSPLTPTDANFIRQSGMGSASIQPEDVAGRLVYLGRNRKAVYELDYSDDRKTYNPLSLTLFREHIASTGIAAWAFQQQPIPILWAVTSDGYLLGLTRVKGVEDQPDIIAWHRRVTDGTFESVAVIPSDTDDEVWVEVARTVSGSTVRSIERMKPFDWGTSQRDCFFVDDGYKWDGGAAVTITGIAVNASTNRVTVTASGMTDTWTVRLAGVVGMTDVNGRVYTVADATATTFVLKTRDGTAYIDGSTFTAYASGGTVERVANSVTGLTWLASETVKCLLDGQPADGTVTAAGVYTVGSYKDKYYHNTIIVGRPYTSKLSPMRPEVRTISGSIQAKRQKVTYCGLRLYQSAGGKLGTSADDAVDIDYRQPGDLANADQVLVTRDVYQAHPGGWQEHGDIYVETSDPLPMTVTAIVFGLE
jgi:hypothetical protein